MKQASLRSFAQILLNIYISGDFWPKNDVSSRKVSLILQVIFALMATLLLTLGIVGLAVVLLGVRIFFVKGGRFPNTHIHDNPEMRKRGIKCARDKEFYN